MRCVSILTLKSNPGCVEWSPGVSVRRGGSSAERTKKRKKKKEEEPKKSTQTHFFFFEGSKLRRGKQGPNWQPHAAAFLNVKTAGGGSAALLEARTSMRFSAEKEEDENSFSSVPLLAPRQWEACILIPERWPWGAQHCYAPQHPHSHTLTSGIFWHAWPGPAVSLQLLAAGMNNKLLYTNKEFISIYGPSYQRTSAFNTGTPMVFYY